MLAAGGVAFLPRWPLARGRGPARLPRLRGPAVAAGQGYLGYVGLATPLLAAPCYRPLRRKARSRGSGQVLITSSGVSQPRRAVPTP